MRYYVDTSVFGGYYDEGYDEWSRLFFDQIVDNKFKVIYSNVTVDELRDAPEKVKRVLQDLPKECKQFIETDEKADRLAETYIEAGILSAKCLNDALHIALASIHAADVLTSWNFKHMINLNRIEAYNKINSRYGYPSIDIREPKALIL